MQIALRKSFCSRCGKEAAPTFAVVAVGAVLSVLLGYALSRGGRLSEAMAGVGLVIVVAALLSRLRWRALTVWIVLCGPLYPFFRYPSQHTLITFDRVWITGLIVVLVVTARSQPRARASRLTSFAVLWLTLAAGVRAVTTPTTHLSVLTTWFDAFAIPAGVFFAARRFGQTVPRLISFAKALTIAGAVLSAIAVAEKLLGFELATKSGGVLISELGGAVRVTGPFAYPEMLATALLVCLAATIFLIQVRGGITLALGLTIVVLELGAIGLTLFRTAWIAALVVVVVGIALRPRRIVRLAVGALIAGGVALAAVGPLESNQLISSRINNSQNIYSRLGTYVDAYHIFVRHPAFGVGIGEFGNAEANLGSAETTINGGQAAGTAHDSFLEVLSEHGIWGLLPLLVLMAAWAQVLLRYRRLSADRVDQLFLAGAIAATLGYLLMSVTETIILEEIPNAFFAVMVGATAGRLDALTLTCRPPQPSQAASSEATAAVMLAG